MGPPLKRGTGKLLSVYSASSGFFWPMKSETPSYCHDPPQHQPTHRGLHQTLKEAKQDRGKAQISKSQHGWGGVLSWEPEPRDLPDSPSLFALSLQASACAWRGCIRPPTVNTQLLSVPHVCSASLVLWVQHLLQL